MGSPNPQDKVTGHSQYNAVHQYLISRPNKVNKHTFLYFTNLFDKHYQQSELRYWDLGRFVHGRIWGLNRLPGRDGEIGEARVSWYKLTITRPMNTPSSKYLNLARRGNRFKSWRQWAPPWGDPGGRSRSEACREWGGRGRQGSPRLYSGILPLRLGGATKVLGGVERQRQIISRSKRNIISNQIKSNHQDFRGGLQKRQSH